VRRALLALLLAATAHAGEPDRALLKAQGIACEADPLGAYLQTLRLGAEEREEALQAVRNLGSDDPVTRHEALLDLTALAAPPLDAIHGAMSSDDVEVRRVATRLLQEWLRRVRRDLLLAALRTIAEEGVKGLANDVLGVAPLAAELRLQSTLAAALRATLTPGDLAALRLAAGAGEIETRCAAVRALGAAPGAGVDEAAPYLDARDERLRLAAALALADGGDRRCLPALAALLSAETPPVRRGAAEALRIVCGGRVGYDPFAGPEARRGAAEAWRKRIAALPEGTAWEHPLPVGIRQLGRTLISLFREGRLVELDAEDHRTFEVTGLQGPWAIQGLPNGHRLVALHPLQTIVEYDTEGQEISRLRVPGRPGGFERLESGNTLVALTDQKRIVELRPDGSMAAEFNVRGSPMDVHTLDNDHLLVCLGMPVPEVIEVERTGRVVWSLRGQQHIYTAQRLENGNTLIAEAGGPGGRAAEYDAAGAVVWERAGLQQCYSAERLADGGTIVADATGVREIAPDGEERWILRTASFCRASRY